MAIRKLTPHTQTVRGNDDSTRSSDYFVRNWDAKAGIEQAMQRTDLRASQGQKMTPIGAGKLKRGR